MNKYMTMTDKRSALQASFDWLEILVIFLLGFWLIVVRPLGPNLSLLPGDLGDTRFNNYILEHDYRWITGQDASLWNAPFFYPYPQTLTFSDNHFGSMFFYDTFRATGLDRETSLQAWYLLSYCLSFVAAAYVLKKLGLKPLAIGMGAFFFTFGLPVLGQENHIQLFYRFCIPLACYAFWQFSQKQRFRQLVLTWFWLVWQFYLSIYMGFFLSLLLVVVALGLPFTQKISFSSVLYYWPRSIKKAWQNSKMIVNAFTLFLIAALLLALIVLFRPYVLATETYSFSRSWQEVSNCSPEFKVISFPIVISCGNPLHSFPQRSKIIAGNINYLSGYRRSSYWSWGCSGVFDLSTRKWPFSLSWQLPFSFCSH